MLDSSRIDRITQNFMDRYTPQRRLFLRIWFLSLAGLTLVALIIVTPLLYASLTRLLIAVAIIIGSATMLAVTGFIIHHYLNPWKATLEGVQAELVSMLAEQGEPVYGFIAGHAADKPTYRAAGLFPRHITITERYRFRGTTSTGKPYVFHECVLMVNQGQYGSRVVFSGMFVVLPPQGGVFQLRSHGKPRHKGVSYQKGDTVEKITAYLGEPTSNVPSYLSKTLNAMLQDNVKRVYFAANESGTYLAISRPYKRLTPPLNREKIEGKLRDLKTDLSRIEAIASDPFDGFS